MSTADAGRRPAAPSVASISPALRRLIVVLVVGLALVTLGVYARQYLGPDRFSKDFAVDYVSARALVDGKDPYTPIQELIGEYLHPPRDIQNGLLVGSNWHTPAKIVVTVPVALLPYRAAGVAWVLLTALCFVGAGALLAKGLGWRLSTGLFLGVVAIIVPVGQKDLMTGNVNGLLLLLLMTAWYFLRRNRDAAAGFAIGVAAAFKVFPGLLVVPLIAMRRWKTAAWAVGSTGLLTLIGVSIIGPSQVVGYIRAGSGSQGFGYWDQSPANFGWWGFATRWLSQNGWVRHLSLDPLALVLAVAGVAVFFVLLARPRADFTHDIFWSSIPLTLLVWPIVWDHYLVLMFPWVVLGGRGILRRGRGTMVAFGLIASQVFIGMIPGGRELSAVQLWQEIAFQFPVLALIAAVIIDRRRASSSTGERVDMLAPVGSAG